MRFQLKTPGFKRSFLVLAAFSILAFSINAPGQDTRRKRVPTPTPLPVVPRGEAQVISRADDYLETNDPLVQKAEEQKADFAPRDPDETSRLIQDLRQRISGLEAAAKKGDPDEKQKRLLLNLDILNRAEQRSDSIRKQLFEMIEKENTTKTRIDIIEMSLRPEVLEREISLSGSLRPEDLRAVKKRQLEVERTNLQSVLSEIQRTKTMLEQNLRRSDEMVERLRVKMEKEIEDSLIENKPF
jgi:hypothetical protein